MRYLVLLFCAIFVGCSGNNPTIPDGGNTGVPNHILDDVRNEATAAKDDLLIDKLGSRLYPDFDTNSVLLEKYNGNDIKFHYFNSGQNKSSIKKQSVTSKHVLTEFDDYGNGTRYKHTNIRRIIETDLLDIYIDLYTTTTNHMRVSSYRFSYDNWVNFINNFIKNKDKFDFIYGRHYDDNFKTKLKVIFTDLNDMTGYVDHKDIEATNLVVYVSRKFLDDKNLIGLENEFFYQLQHLQNACKSRYPYDGYESKDYTAKWIDKILSESTLYVVREDTINSEKFNYFNNDYKGEIKVGSYFTTFNYKKKSSVSTCAVFTYWLYKQFGTNIFKNIAGALTKNGVIGVAEFVKIMTNEESGFTNWSSIYSTWLQANFYNNDYGLKGYKDSVFKFKVNYLTIEDNVYLGFGGAVYLPPGARIKSSDNKLVDIKLSSMDTTAILVYNKDTDLSNYYSLILSYDNNFLIRDYINLKDSSVLNSFSWGDGVVLYD